MSNKAIGEITCPLCRSPRAKVTVSKAGLTVATCNRCHVQIFTRSDLSDAALRGQMRPMKVEEVAPASPAIEAAATPEMKPASAAPESRPSWLQW